MKFSVLVKRLKHPQVRRRLKIGLSVWGVAIMLGLLLKFTYDIGYFKARSLVNDRNAAVQNVRQVLTMESAQRIVTGALKEDPSSPKTILTQVVDSDQSLATVIVENNKQKKIAWIIDLRLFFTGALYNDKGYNLTESIEHQYDISAGNH